MIRPAMLPDLPEITSLDEEAFAPYGTAESPDVIAARLAVFPQGFVVAQAGATLVGYASSEKWDSEREPALDENPTQTHAPKGRLLCITAMAVRRDRQREGWGTRLLERITEIAHSEGCHTLVLETSHARTFYERHGFTVTRERSERDALLFVMHKRLL